MFLNVPSLVLCFSYYNDISDDAICKFVIYAGEYYLL